MSTCRYDRETAEYIKADGTVCLTDDYGDPTRHCTAKRTCSQHIAHGEITCARCIGRTRSILRRIVTLAPFANTLATTGSVESELVNLAGPVADPNTWAIRRRNAQARLFNAWRSGDITEEQLDRAYEAIEDDDDLHPANLLTRWEMMLREDYAQPSNRPATLTGAAAYIDANLARIAQDSEQDFPLLARELRTCKNHLELVESLSLRRVRGATCPACIDEGSTPAPRLELHRGHWCEDPECRKEHWPEDPDMWRCPRNREHKWTDVAYRLRVDLVYATHVGT